jgi:putative colanic acid biosynthesis acetyltransferase WcaF
MKSPVQLARYDNSWFKPGASRWKVIAWYFLGRPLVRAAWMPSSTVRASVLRWFGASIGEGVVLKPSIDVKYPWHLSIGDHCWVGEGVWIDNLTTVRLASNVCVSQGAYLCTGNHDWSDPFFGLRVATIVLEEGSWVGAKAILTPGTHLSVCSVAGAGAVVSGFVPEFEVHAGNPARFVRMRSFRGAPGDPSYNPSNLEQEDPLVQTHSTHPSARERLS